MENHNDRTQWSSKALIADVIAAARYSALYPLSNKNRLNEDLTELCARLEVNPPIQV